MGIKPGKPKKSGELIRELTPGPRRGWVAGFFVSKVGGRLGRFCHFDRSSSENAVQSQVKQSLTKQVLKKF